MTAIVVHAAHRLGSRSIDNNLLWAIAAAAFVAMFALNIPFPLIVVGTALIGYFGDRIAPHSFKKNNGHRKEVKSYGAALVNDHTPAPEHVRFLWSRLIMTVVIGGLLWLMPMALLTINYGGEHTLTQMAWFFTKAALLTFGGAYAVLPYIYQGAVEYYGWLTPEQMIDGLALGEATPGPLIIVVAFVAFLGGYGKEIFGSDMLFLAGIAAATLVTWFTFLPSFIFILAGGPLAEATHDDLRFTAPLKALTAAVVGVILNLAMFFGYYVLWPQGFTGRFDWIAALIAFMAAIALFRFRRNVIEIIAACALIGLTIKTFL